MQPAKRQIIALGLLLMVALPLFLSVGIFIKQKIVQHQRRQRFETEMLQTIRVSADKLYWVKPGKEILINDELFDVKSFTISGTDVLLTGFYDHKEDELVKHMVDLIHKKDNSHRPVDQAAVQFVFYPTYNQYTVVSIQNTWRLIKRQFPVYKEATASLAYPAPTPPPKYC